MIIKGFYRRARLRFYAWVITSVARREPDLLAKFLQEKSLELSVGMTMSILDREGINHCMDCPARFPLRVQVVGGMKRYKCERHFQKEAAAKAA